MLRRITKKEELFRNIRKEVTLIIIKLSRII
jgi:hypothetical protein